MLNEAGIIEQRLHQLRTQVGSQVELIVVDGGSEDNTLGLAEFYADQVLVSRIKGRAQQMNTGAMQANGSVILFLHIDTQLPPKALAVLNGIGAEQWGFFHLRLSGRQWPFRLIETMINLRSSISKVATGDQAIFIGKSLFKQQQGFADIPLMEDVELSKRLRKQHQAHIISAPVLTSSRRWEERGIWQTVILMWRLRWDYFRGVSPEKLVSRYY